MNTPTLKKRDDKLVIYVKVPPEMRDWLKDQAAQGYRSMSAQALLFLDAARKQVEAA